MAKEKQQLFDTSDEPQGPVECLGMTFENDAERREHFLQLLREKLKDPEFRAIDGFPKGDDESILSLSDPPYYTACPNPFVIDFVTHSKKTRGSISQGHKRTPFATDVSEGKNDPIYNAHSYHTKVPPKAIVRFLLHFTEPGDVVLDGFCGTGMTGVAAQLCGDATTLKAMGFTINSDGGIVDGNGLTVSKLGSRLPVLVDLSPAATFISHNYNRVSHSESLEAALSNVLNDAEAKFAWMFQTLHEPEAPTVDRALTLLANRQEHSLQDDNNFPFGRINYVVWSDIFTCPECASDVIFWDVAVDISNGKVRDSFPCPSCNVSLNKRNMLRSWTAVNDSALQDIVQQTKRVPVYLSYTYKKKRYEKTPDRFDLALIEEIDRAQIHDWFPTAALPDGYNTTQPIKSHGYTHVHHFYTRRSLAALAFCRKSGFETWLPFSALTPRATKMHRIAASRLGGPKKGVGGATVGVISGTLYVPSISVEMNVLDQAEDRIRTIIKSLGYRDSAIIGTQSCTSLPLANESVDYVFTDPPFGGNLMYSELNTLWEGWLDMFTNNEPEAIANSVQKKGLLEYQQIMTRCFEEYCRVLKPGRWITVEFHNSQNSVWNAIQESLQHAGFVIADVRTLDKKQGSFKQVTSVAAVKQDLTISAYKPNGGLESRFQSSAGTDVGVWDFVETHLRQIPVFVAKKGCAENIAERQDFLLFDRMVAFHVQRGVSVPLSAAEFYFGLREKYPERDGMFFLPEQVSEYDRKRLTVNEVEQLDLFVTDEASAIRWLKRTLKARPQTFQELQPQFMQEVAGWQKHERTLELSELLEQNFLCCELKDEVPSQIHAYLSSNFKELRKLDKSDPNLKAKAKGRWYVADPRKEVDLEKIRHHALIKEFNVYRQTKGKLKTVRTEALRLGFKECWQNKDYDAIIEMVGRVREEIIQEDTALLMYYDNALMLSAE